MLLGSSPTGVMAFQRAAGLDIDGDAGRETHAALHRALTQALPVSFGPTPVGPKPKPKPKPAWLVLAVLALIARYVPLVARLYADQCNRDALHEAIASGVDFALATAESGARLVRGVQQVDAALGYVERSVPGALKHFATKARDHVRAMIVARLEGRARDPLTEALQQAGAAD